MTHSHDHDEVESPEDPAYAPDAVAALLADHRATFLAFVERRVGSRAVAEDLLQAAFARGLARVATLRDEESAVAWFYRVLRNAVIDFHRRQSTATRALDAFAAELEAAEQPDDATRAEVCRCVAQLAGALKPEYAAALRRIEVDGVPVKTFAAESGISASNAAVRVFRAREALRRQVVRSCGACAAHGCLDCSCQRTEDAETHIAARSD